MDVRPFVRYRNFMATLLTPHFGARFQLDRLSVDDAVASYAARIYLPEVHYQYTIRISVHTGDCAVIDEGSLPAGAQAASPWVGKHLVALSRQLFRSAKKDGVWQRRVMRWHGAPEVTAGHEVPLAV